MNKLSKYFSLLKYSLSNPKNGINLFNEVRQTRNVNDKIKKYSIKSSSLEECLKTYFPSYEISREELLSDTKILQTHLKNYFKNFQNLEFPSKKKPYPTDYSINTDSCLFLYSLCKILKPNLIVETGVAYGHSSSYILQALNENGKGMLYSIDDTFRPWESREMIGSAIPSNLKKQWKLTFGSSSKKLKEVLNSFENIDIFLHDSLHSYDNMFYEFKTAWPHLAKNGFLLSDDVLDNNAFQDFCLSKKLNPILVKDSVVNSITFGTLKKE